MLIGFNTETNELRQVCNRCGMVHDHVIEKRELPFLEEFGEYENMFLPTCECGNMEGLNMNIPEDEYEISHLIPDHDWIARCVIKSMRRWFLGETEELEIVIQDKKPYIQDKGKK